MATKEMKVCDVYGVTRGVETYLLRLTKQDSDYDETDTVVRNMSVDLCPRAVKRCERFMLRATTKPGAAVRKDQERPISE